VRVTLETQLSKNRYGALLEALPVDLACAAVGENGHLAFNDPPGCNFWDRNSVKVYTS
jgi:glucosamine-6-phosphate deaminase